MQENKSDNNYLLMVNTYKARGIDSIDKAYSEKTYIQKKTLLICFVVSACLILLMLLLPKLIVFWLMLAILINTWVWLSARYGLRFIDRYIVEELNNSSS